MIERESDYEIKIEGVELKIEIRFRNKYDVALIQKILNHISEKETWDVNFTGELKKK